MSLRVYELAKHLKKNNKEILDVLQQFGTNVKTHSSTVDDETSRRLLRYYEGPGATLPKSEASGKPVSHKPPRPRKPQAEAKKPAHPKPEHKKPAVEKAEKHPEGETVKEAPKEAKPAIAEAEKPAIHKPAPAAPAAAVEKPAPKQEAKEKEKKKPVDEKLEAYKEEIKQKLERHVKPAEPVDKPGNKKLFKTPVKPPKRPFATVIDEKVISEMLPEEMTEMKVPDRFKKDIEADKVEKFKVKPGMQKAFQAIRKIDSIKKAGPGQFGQFAQFGKKKEREKFDHRMDKTLPASTAPRKKSLKIQEGMTVKEFADIISVKIPDVVKKFMELGMMANINQPVDIDAAMLVADGFGIKLEIEQPEDVLMAGESAVQEISNLIPRPPIVTIMGHVDHGKTSLLDAIRETKVMDTEAGGITQHIGAYKVSIKGKEIVFLDTPGHEAFTSLRARGAKVTDIVVLIVAADDGVMPQTIEAIDHAKAANVPIIVAINKIDKPGANAQRVMTQLTEHGIVSEEWGGASIFAQISAKQRIGIEGLLELILLQAEVLELKAETDKPAKGVIIEAKLDKGRGPVATVLVQGGTLKIGDVFLSGINTGKVKALWDDMGKRLESAGPSTPVEVLGFGSVPTAGDSFAAMDDERKARQIAMAREAKLRSAEVAKKRKLTLDELYSMIKEGNIKELAIIIKADVQGSVEAIREALLGIKHPEVQVRVIHGAVGGINESDVMLAAASRAIIIGFNVRPELKASQLAEKEGIDIELYNIIYHAIEDVKKALEGMLEPTLKERILGHAEVRQVFHISRVGNIAGCMVLDGTINRASDGVRVVRDNIVVYEGRLSTLKRFKDDAKEVQAGYECGITIENFNDLKPGDVLENFVIEKIAAKL